METWALEECLSPQQVTKCSQTMTFILHLLSREGCVWRKEEGTGKEIPDTWCHRPALEQALQGRAGLNVQLRGILTALSSFIKWGWQPSYQLPRAAIKTVKRKSRSLTLLYQPASQWPTWWETQAYEVWTSRGPLSSCGSKHTLNAIPPTCA